MSQPAVNANPYREVPSVDELLKLERVSLLVNRFGRTPVKDALTHDLDSVRDAIKKDGLSAPDVAARCGSDALLARVEHALAAKARRNYVHTVNATGVILHTGLGRAPLARAAQEALADAARSYAILEVDRASGERNKREEAIASLLREITGAQGATVVNNNAAATLICLAALAVGRGVVVSRGQLVEIGGSFRIPDVMTQSGARLVEVGTTNKTHIEDYERAIDDKRNDVALVLRVHPSNFKILGFVEEVSLPDLVALSTKRGLPVMDDLGSGCFVDLAPYGLGEEPVVQVSLEQGSAVATFSGDKLLGGPQAGLIVGKKTEVDKIRKHPLFRAMRPDKLTLAALEATLMLYRDPQIALAQVPVIRMISLPLARVDERARSLAVVAAQFANVWEASVIDDASMVGGGSYAIDKIPTRALALAPRTGSADAISKRFRQFDPPIFTRINEDRVLLDPRTIDPDEDRIVARALETVARDLQR